MKIYRGFNHLQGYTSENGTVLSIGTFDGVHLAHREIVDAVVSKAKEISATSTIVTFDPHPRIFFGRGQGLSFVSSMDEKLKILGELGVDNVIIQPFDDSFAKLSSVEFMESYLIERLNIKAMVVGYDHSFGSERGNAFEFLNRVKDQYHIQVIRIEKLNVGDLPVSSSSVRRAIFKGNFTAANALLGYRYSFSGEVVYGKQLGRTLGYPTANIELYEPMKLIPPDGVYLVRVFLDENEYFGMMNCGIRPTINDELGHTIEVNIFDFDRDIYGVKLTVEPLQRIRAEMKFDSLRSLITRLEIDKRLCIEEINRFF